MICPAIPINCDLIIADTQFQREHRCIIENCLVDKANQNFGNMDVAHIIPCAGGVVRPKIVDAPLTLTFSPIAYAYGHA